MKPQSYVSPWLAVILRPIHKVFMALYFRVRVHHADRLPREGPVILAPTHRSRWDTFMLYCAVRDRYLRFLTSHNETEGLQGWFVRRLGAFPINTRRPTPGALKHCEELLISGQALVIFPEGNIFRIAPDTVHPLKPGTAWLAMHVQRQLGDVPLKIIPVRLNYSDRFLHAGSQADVIFEEPIVVSDYFDRSDKDAMRAITADLQNALGDRVDDRPHEVANARDPESVSSAEPGPSSAEPDRDDATAMRT